MKFFRHLPQLFGNKVLFYQFFFRFLGLFIPLDYDGRSYLPPAPQLSDFLNVAQVDFFLGYQNFCDTF